MNIYVATQSRVGGARMRGAAVVFTVANNDDEALAKVEEYSYSYDDYGCDEYCSCCGKPWEAPYETTLEGAISLLNFYKKYAEEDSIYLAEIVMPDNTCYHHNLAPPGTCFLHQAGLSICNNR